MTKWEYAQLQTFPSEETAANSGGAEVVLWIYGEGGVRGERIYSSSGKEEPESAKETVKNFHEQLAKMGSEGWELVTVNQVPEGVYVWFKRPVECARSKWSKQKVARSTTKTAPSKCEIYSRIARGMHGAAGAESRSR